MGACLRKNKTPTHISIRESVPRLNLPDATDEEVVVVPYKDTWLKGNITSVSPGHIYATVSFDGVNISFKVRRSNGSLDDIHPGGAEIKPLEWGRKSSLIADVNMSNNLDGVDRVEVGNLVELCNMDKPSSDPIFSADSANSMASMNSLNSVSSLASEKSKKTEPSK